MTNNRYEPELKQKVLRLVYGKYNHVRPHRANGGLTPYAARCRAA
ncbi:hypothetical protein QK901_04575 [Streptococcus thermophilus]